MSKEALEVYAGHELPLKFVARDVDGKETPLWRYCRERFGQRWSHVKPRRDVPAAHEGGRSGWWFPQAWVSDYHDARHPAAVATREPSPEARARMAARLGKVISSTAGTMSLGALNWQGFPGLQEFERWKLPAGTIIVAANNTVIYPDGTVETWAATESRMRKPAPRAPSKPEPLVEEVAVTPSPELLAALRRKEWLAKQERGEGEPPIDPQAWRFEMEGAK